MNVDDYNSKIANLVIDSVKKYLEQEDKLKIGERSFLLGGGGG